MRIVSTYNGSQQNWQTSEKEVTFGRTGEKSGNVLDLSPDQKVSRLHGRIWQENGSYWIEDLNSGRGTLLNSTEIKGQGKKEIQTGDVIVVGNTTIQVESLDPPTAVTAQTNFLEPGTNLPPDEPRVQTAVDIIHELDASAFNPLPPVRRLSEEIAAAITAGGSKDDTASSASRLEEARQLVTNTLQGPPMPAAIPSSSLPITSNARTTGLPGPSPLVDSISVADIAERRLTLVCEFPMHLAAKAQLPVLLPAIVDRLVEMVPEAQCWALLLRENKTDTLLLKAYRSVQQPSLSETLARRALTKRNAFIWKRGVDPESRGDLLEDSCVTGIYAPMLWQEEAVGVICATAWNADTAFSKDDLQLVVVVAQYAAMAVASHQLQEKLRQESVVRANLLRQFSPQIADRLLAHRGRLRLGGNKSEVTILIADIRGFTRLTQDMDPEDVVELLNDYFSVLVPVIFAHEGTIDKYMGDAVLAIFGSPVADANHHEHAVFAAVEMQTAVAKLNELRRLRGSPCCGIGIGMNCGEVVHGLVGTQNRMEFTVIGDAVNKTSRYCSGADAGEVIISPDLYEHLWGMVQTDQTTIHTKHEGDFVAYRVMRLKTENNAEN
jgi:class 3 adenylate cyclase